MMFEESTSSMSCGTTNAKGTRVALVFDGSKEKFEEYWENVTLLFAVNEMDHLLSEDIDSDFPAKESDASTAAQKKLVKQNKIGMAKVQISIECATLRKQVKAKVITRDWPSGKLWMLKEFLLKKYRPKDRIAIAEQKGKLMTLKLGKGEDPALYEEAVIELEVSYDTEFTEEDKISTALIALGPEHGKTMYNAIQQIEDKGELVTFSDLMEAVKDKRRALLQGRDDEDDEPTETALVTARRPAVRTADYNPNVFCWYCAEQGHIKRKCPIWLRVQEKLKNTKCGYPGCGRMGHTTEMCWNDPKNASKRPANFKPSTDSNVDTIEVLV